MKIYIANDLEKPRRKIYLQELAAIAQPQIHSLVENPAAADAIIITQEDLSEPFVSSLLDKYLNKCYTINMADSPLFGLAGLYASGNKSCWLFRKHLIRGCSYIYALYQENQSRNQFVDFSQAKNTEKKYLLSFVGAGNSWLRKRLFKLKFQRSDILIRCTNDYNHWIAHQPNREAKQKHYVDTIQNSQFVLCPRGAGWGSIRLFEVMKLGVAPVIISDKWLPPAGPDWHSFALFIKHSDLKNLEKIVASHAAEYESRGRLAREAWSEYFADAVIFNRCIAAIEDLKANRIPILDRAIFYSYPLMLTIDNLKNQINDWIKSIILKLFDLFKLQFPYELVNK